MLQKNQLYGKCPCGAFNALSATECTTCGSRLPWADKVVAAAAAAKAAVPAAQVDQPTVPAYYWDNVFGSGLNDRAATPPLTSSTPLTRSLQNEQRMHSGRQTHVGRTAPQPIVTSSVPAYQYCPRCGTGLGQETQYCPVCRKDTLSSLFHVDRHLVKFSFNIGMLIVGGFILGVIWCSFLFTYFVRNPYGTPAPAPAATHSVR